MARRTVKQLELALPMRGGKRKGAGRKRETPRPTVAHVQRQAFKPDCPVQVTLRLREGLPTLRSPAAWAVIVDVLRAVRERVGFRVVHVSVQSNHIHAIVEADTARDFSLGMRALTTRLALRVNRLFERRGKFFDHRFHMRVLTSPSEVRWSLQYVLLNAHKHARQRRVQLPVRWRDPYSSAATFDGWIDADPRTDLDLGLAAPCTWLLGVGWRKLGLLRLGTTPGSTPFESALVASGLRSCARDCEGLANSWRIPETG
jgi:REP element-mobilizing transposase RayT